jgi:hypothetical protein
MFQLLFHIVLAEECRGSTYKYNKSSLEILIESKEDIRPEVLTLPALDLDKLFQIKFNLPPPFGGS